MANKKAGRLAGLAALAGLAYMNKDKLFGTEGKTKAAASAPAAIEKSRTYAETAEDEDAEMGRAMRANEMLARGVAEGKKIDGSDRFAGPATTKDTEFGDLEGAIKRNAETKTTPAKVARTASSVKAPSAPVTKMPEGAFRGRRSDIVGGGRSGGRGGPEAGEEAASKPAGAYYAPGAYRGMRSDPEPVGAYRSIRSDPEPEGAYRGMRSDMKKGGKVKKMASGGTTSSASKRGDGIAQRGKTRGKMR